MKRVCKGRKKSSVARTSKPFIHTAICSELYERALIPNFWYLSRVKLRRQKIFNFWVHNWTVNVCMCVSCSTIRFALIKKGTSVDKATKMDAIMAMNYIAYTHTHKKDEANEPTYLHSLNKFCVFSLLPNPTNPSTHQLFQRFISDNAKVILSLFSQMFQTV